MRPLALAAALLLAPALTSAQAPAGSQTFAGCDLFACATFTLRYTSAPVQGQTTYAVTGDGTFTPLAPLVTGAYGLIPLPTLGGAFFGDLNLTDLRYLTTISLVGRAVGQGIPIQLVGTTGVTTRQQPVLNLVSLSGTLVGPNGAVTADRVNIPLVAVAFVPEPATFALVAGGLAVLGAGARRRRVRT